MHGEMENINENPRLSRDYAYTYTAPLFTHTQMTEERVDKYISTVYFSDVNLQKRCVHLFG